MTLKRLYSELSKIIDEESKTLQALILVPTRELAVQTTQRAKEFFRFRFVILV